MFSIIIPVYKNEDNIKPLIDALNHIAPEFDKLEVVFVVDGSPDNSYLNLKSIIPECNFVVQLLSHSRNFGSFAAVHTGLKYAKGVNFGSMAADLQEPPQLMVDFYNSLTTKECDVAIGTRSKRNDSFIGDFLSNSFWFLYRKFIIPDLPPGGVDVFGCNKEVRDTLVNMSELNTSLVGLLYWIGYKRKTHTYERRQREIGVSAWTFTRKLQYLMDSIFAFTNLPIKLLTFLGFASLGLSLCLGALVLITKVSGITEVPGYAGTIITILFFASLNSIGLSIIGNYCWRAYDNTKGRPVAIVSNS